MKVMNLKYCKLSRDYLTPVLLFDQERVLGSQHSGTKPTRRSSSHSSSVRLVNKEDLNAMKPPNGLHPLYLPGHPFLVVLEKTEVK